MPVLRPQHRRQHIITIGGNIIVEFITNNRSERGKNICGVDHLIRNQTIGEMTLPTCDKGNAVAALPRIALHASPSTGSGVVVILTHPVYMYGLGAVVRVENNQCVIINPERFYQI